MNIQFIRTFSHVNLWELKPTTYVEGDHREVVSGQIIGEGQCSERCADVAIQEGCALPLESGGVPPERGPRFLDGGNNARQSSSEVAQASPKPKSKKSSGSAKKAKSAL